MEEVDKRIDHIYIYIYIKYDSIDDVLIKMMIGMPTMDMQTTR
jgi:hypothetical protein